MGDYLIRHAASLDDATSGYIFGGTNSVTLDTELELESLL